MKVRPLSILATILIFVAFFTLLSTTSAGAAPGPASRTVQVDCTQGKTVGQALTLPADELFIEISGVCVEDVIIERDRVTLSGVTPDATLQGNPTSPDPVVTVRGASRIEIRDLKITGGEAIGARIHRNAEARLRNVSITQTPFFGLFIDESSSALLIDTEVTDHGALGVTVFGDSGITVQGTNDFSRNGQFGLFMSSGGSLHTNGVGQILANDNGEAGIFLQIGATGLFPSVEARRNGIAGVDLTFGGEFFSIGSNNFSDNGVFGATMGDGATYFAAGQVMNNGSVGIFAEEGSHVNVVTNVPSHIAGSPVAVLLEGASGTFGGNVQPVGTVTIDGRMELTFGSRATFGTDVVLGTLACDSTVLTQGAISCPSSLSAVRASGLGSGLARTRHGLPQPQQPVLPQVP